MHFGMPMEISPTDSWLSEEHQMIHIRSDRKKELHAVFFSYLFCCAGALCTILEFYFICITGIRHLNLNLNKWRFSGKKQNCLGESAARGSKILLLLPKP
jgi:hypothetical protein